jgi:Fe2+ transport system protein FeoA
MDENRIPLSRLKPGEQAVVAGLEGDTSMTQRLMEMGITPGCNVAVVRFAPMGDPIDIKVRGYHLSLRRKEAELILVRL